MLAKVNSFGLLGIVGYPVTVEADILPGQQKYDIVGLGDTAIKESRERVRSAIKNSGYSFPFEHIIINLAPADLKKEGPVYDLSIAISILAASGQVNWRVVGGYIFIGELSLSGGVKHVKGILPILISAREKGFTKFIIPLSNAIEASYIPGVEVYTVECLRDAVDFFLSAEPREPIARRECGGEGNSTASDGLLEWDFAFVKGQQTAKRAMEIAVSGGHNILMIGAPGSGKTMLSKCICGIMPDMTFDEMLESTKIHSVAGELDPEKGIISRRPFRSPHHTATVPSLVGGGSKARPGEISLAHNGVLFLDEMPEYSRHTLEILRQPLEDGKITVARASAVIEYPAQFMLVASMNPCPCGNYGSKTQKCRCTAAEIKKYLAKLSGPLLDRIDLHVEVDNVKYEEISQGELAERSADIKKRINKARAVQRERYGGRGVHCNASMGSIEMKKYCSLTPDCAKLLENVFEKLKLSARGYTRILKVARTIADLEGSEEIKKDHIAEAITYRTLDRKYW